MSRDELVSGLVRIGEMMVAGENQAEIDASFPPDFTFHGPGRRRVLLRRAGAKS
jgi:hypothetical protein